MLIPIIISSVFVLAVHYLRACDGVDIIISVAPPIDLGICMYGTILGFYFCLLPLISYSVDF